MLKKEIKQAMINIAKTNKGGNAFIVVKDTEKGGIHGTDADINNILSAGGVMCVLNRQDVLESPDYIIEQNWWYWRENKITNLDDLCEKIADVWE